MSIPITKPTVNGSNGTWGTELNTALDVLADVQTAYKSADESVTSSTTLQDDDHLVNLSLSIGTYIVDAMYLVSGAAAGDVKVAWAFSGTATGYRGGQGPGQITADVLSAAASEEVRAAAAGATSAAITSATAYGCDGSNWGCIMEKGVLVVTVAGTLKVQWAQNGSNATATIMRAGSFIRAMRVA